MTGYPDWMKRYAALFSLNRPEDGATFVAWEQAFDKAEFTLEDLESATDHIALNPPQTRAAHLKALMERCRVLKAERQQASLPFGGFPGQPCEMCLRSGYVVVPHILTIRKKTRGYRTMAVSCVCTEGKKRQGISLEFYERHAPDWREWAKEQEDDSEARRGMAGIPLHQQFELLRDRLAENFKIPRRPWPRQPPAGMTMEEYLRREVE